MTEEATNSMPTNVPWKCYEWKWALPQHTLPVSVRKEGRGGESHGTDQSEVSSSFNVSVLNCCSIR